MILTGFGHTDNGSLHGLIFGPDGRLYMTMGDPDGYRLRRPTASTWRERAARCCCGRTVRGPRSCPADSRTSSRSPSCPTAGSWGPTTGTRRPAGRLRDAVVHLVEGGLYPQNSYSDERTPQSSPATRCPR